MFQPAWLITGLIQHLEHLPESFPHYVPGMEPHLQAGRSLHSHAPVLQASMLAGSSAAFNVFS